MTFIGGNYIAIGTSANDYSSGNVYIFNINGSMVWNYTTEGGVSDIFAIQDGNYITVGTEKSGLSIVYLFTKDGKLIWAYNTSNPVNGVLVNDNGSYIISVGGSGFYRFNKQGNILSSYRTSSSLHYVTASRDLQVVVFGSLNKLYFVDFSSKLVPAVLKIETNPPGSEVYLNGKYWGTAPLDI